MKPIWMAVHPQSSGTRVIATEGRKVILKARLRAVPEHPRALQWLLEAVALWEGERVHGALCVGGARGGSATSFRADWFSDFGGPLYALEVVDLDRRRPSTALEDRLDGLGEFRDLKTLRRAHCSGGSR